MPVRRRTSKGIMPQTMVRFVFEQGGDMGFLEWLQAKPDVQAPPAPEPEYGPVHDDLSSEAFSPADSDLDGRPDTIAGLCVAIDYVDASGASSKRRVVADQVYENGGSVYLQGHCLLRGEDRTFRADRVEKLKLPPDWVEVSDPLAFFESYLNFSSQQSDRWNDYAEQAARYARLYEARRAANHGLRVLAFVARSDGSLADVEVSVIRDYVLSAGTLVGVDLTSDDCNEIASDVGKLFPTRRQVANSLAAIRLYREQSEIFMAALKVLVRADGNITPHEQSAVEMLVELLRHQDKRAAGKA